jgi:hypothetical protein
MPDKVNSYYSIGDLVTYNNIGPIYHQLNFNNRQILLLEDSAKEKMIMI